MAWNMCKIFSLVPSKKPFTRDTDTKKAEQFCKTSTKIDTINIKVDKIIQKDWNISFQISFLVYLWWEPFPGFLKSFPRNSKWLVKAFLWGEVHILSYYYYLWVFCKIMRIVQFSIASCNPSPQMPNASICCTSMLDFGNGNPNKSWGIHLGPHDQLIT